MKLTTKKIKKISSTKARLIPRWSLEDKFEGHHAEDVDVTGGIFLKAKRAGEVADKRPGLRVWIVDGREEERLVAASTVRRGNEEK